MRSSVIFLFFQLLEGINIDNVIELACRRNPSIELCNRYKPIVNVDREDINRDKVVNTAVNHEKRRRTEENVHGSMKKMLDDIVNSRNVTIFDKERSTIAPNQPLKAEIHSTAKLSATGKECDTLFSFVFKFCSPTSFWISSIERLCKSWYTNCASKYSINPISPINRSKSTRNDEKEDDTLKDHPRAFQSKTFPLGASDGAYSAGDFHNFDQFTDNNGVFHRPRSRSPWTKPGLWEANPDDPHNRDHANKWYYHPDSVGVDWLSGQIQWGRHWAVPAVGTGGTDGFSAVHFPTIGNFLNIADDYD